MKILLIAFFLITSASQVLAQVQTGIQEGQNLSFSSRPLRVEEVKDVRLVKLSEYDFQIHIDLTLMTGIKTDKNVVSYFASNGDVFVLEAASNEVWSRGSIGMGIRKHITLVLPYNQMKFSTEAGVDMGTLIIKNNERSFAKIKHDRKKDSFTVDLMK